MRRLQWKRPAFARPGLRLPPATLPIAIGSIAGLLALLTAFLWIPVQRHELASLQDAAANRALLLARRPVVSLPSQAAQPADARFRAGFPPLESRPQRVEALLATAGAQRVAWSRSDFRTEADAVPGIARYRITLPVAGDYAAIRRFVDAALSADPALALERLQLRRSGIASAQVEALTVWSLYTRTDGTTGLQLASAAAITAKASR